MPPCFGMGAFFWRLCRYARELVQDEQVQVLAHETARGAHEAKTMSAHFATAPYTVPVNVNGV